MIKADEIWHYNPIELANQIFPELEWKAYNKMLFKRYAVFLVQFDIPELLEYLRWTIHWEAYEISAIIRDYITTIEHITKIHNHQEPIT